MSLLCPALRSSTPSLRPLTTKATVLRIALPLTAITTPHRLFTTAPVRPFQHTPRTLFHPTLATLAPEIKPGTPLPSLPVLCETSPADKIDLFQELKGVGRAVVLGVPAAFSPGCSGKHVPGYEGHARVKSPRGDVERVVVVSVNDCFVMNAWAKDMKADISGFRYLGDPTCAFTKALGMEFDGRAIFGGDRSKRFALVVENGKVVSVHVEPDGTGTDVSMADKVLG